MVRRFVIFPATALLIGLLGCRPLLDMTVHEVSLFLLSEQEVALASDSRSIDRVFRVGIGRNPSRGLC
jgi:hypothetical protein